MNAAPKTTLLLAVTSVVAAISVYALSTALAAPAKKHTAPAKSTLAHRASRVIDLTPSATQFADDVTVTTMAYANEYGEKARITSVHCVKAASGRYMCSYAITRPNRVPECHLMQARWTPELASDYTVTLAGRVSKCGTLREAIDSLR